jgi:hypothetical protein
LALLAAVELLMSEARRALVYNRVSHRVGAAPVDPAAASAAVLADRLTRWPRPALAAPALAAGGAGKVDTRARVRALLATEQTGGPRLTGKQVAAAVGVKERRAQELPDQKLRTMAGLVVPTSQHTNLPPLVEGPVVRLAGRHAKIRREGYQRRHMP